MVCSDYSCLSIFLGSGGFSSIFKAALYFIKYLFKYSQFVFCTLEISMSTCVHSWAMTDKDDIGQLSATLCNISKLYNIGHDGTTRCSREHLEEIFSKIDLDLFSKSFFTVFLRYLFCFIDCVKYSHRISTNSVIPICLKHCTCIHYQW